MEVQPDILTAIRERRATRAYTARPVDRPTVERLVDAAIRAPSAMNLQPWAFVVFEGADHLKRFSDRAKDELLRMEQAEISPDMRAMVADPAFNMFYEAPVLVAICATSGNPQAAEDCCLAAQNFMLAAYTQGLATCPIGFARPWLNLPATKRELGIPEEFVPIFPIALGYPNETPVDHGRRQPAILWR